MRSGYRFILTASLLVLGALAVVSGTSIAAPPGCTLNAPTLECIGSTPTSITLRVCAGTTGAPAGVSIHWKKLSDFLANGWDQGDSYCNLSLSGACPTSRFDLAPNACENVTIHASTVTDEQGGGFCGASAGDCLSDLECDTEYVFRAFAHNDPGPGGCNRSDFSTTYTCRTAPCAPEGECTLTWGYWKTHGPEGCNPPGHENLWPVDNLTIGGLNLGEAALCDILQESPKACAKGGDPNNGANAVLILQHQLIAAMLNRADGAVVCAFADQAIADANALLVGREYDCVGTSTALGQQMIAVKDLLALYNDHQCTCPASVSGAGQATPMDATTTKSSSWGKVKVIYR